MIIRLATRDDSDDILAWRNDPDSRSMFVNSEIVDRNDHEEWFERAMKDPNRRLYIGIDGSQKLGVCRFDYNPEARCAEISINVAPQKRGQGIGSSMLSASISIYRDEVRCDLFARIKNNNVASKLLFERCGFSPFKWENDTTFYELPITAEPP